MSRNPSDFSKSKSGYKDDNKKEPLRRNSSDKSYAFTVQNKTSIKTSKSEKENLRILAQTQPSKSKQVHIAPKFSLPSILPNTPILIECPYCRFVGETAITPHVIPACKFIMVLCMLFFWLVFPIFLFVWLFFYRKGTYIYKHHCKQCEEFIGDATMYEM